MNLPPLPTDNLYKFIALFGLAIFISSFFLVLDSHFQSRDETGTKLVLAGDLKERKLKEYNEQVEIFELIKKDLETETDSENKSLENLKDKLEELIERESIMNKKYQELFESERDFYEKTFDNNFMVTLVKRNTIKAKILRIIGGFLIVLGFGFWYNKLQRYIDIQRAYEGESYRQKLISIKKPTE